MFDCVLGQESVKEELVREINSNRILHAYTFYGPQGVGKKMLAFEFAKILLKTTNLETSPDFTYIEIEEGKQDISVEQIREKLVQDVYISPAASNYKVYVINDAEKMNDSAQNALLKTLEEPPKTVVIILITTSIEMMLKTIASRTSNIMFKKLSVSDIKSLLAMKGYIATDKIIAYSDGSLGTAIKCLEQNKEVFSSIDEKIGYIQSKDKLRALQAFNDIDFKNEENLKYMQHLFEQNGMYKGVEIVEKAKEDIKQNANEDIVKTTTIVELCNI